VRKGRLADVEKAVRGTEDVSGDRWRLILYYADAGSNPHSECERTGGSRVHVYNPLKLAPSCH